MRHMILFDLLCLVAQAPPVAVPAQAPAVRACPCGAACGCEPGACPGACPVPQSLSWQLAPEYPHPTHDLYRAWDGKGWRQEWRPKGAVPRQPAFAQPGVVCLPGGT